MNPLERALMYAPCTIRLAKRGIERRKIVESLSQKSKVGV